MSVELKAVLEDMGYSESDPEYARIVEAATVQEETEEETAETVEVEPVAEKVEPDNTAELEDAQKRAEVAESKSEALEAENDEFQSTIRQLNEQVDTLNTKVGNFEGWREEVTDRYGLHTSDEEEAAARAGEPEDADKPLASDEEMSDASKQGWEGGVKLFGNILQRYKGRYGDAQVSPDEQQPATARGLSFIRAQQAMQRPGDMPHYQ